MKAAAGSEAQHRFVLPGHPRALADCNFSLGSAEVGAALSSVPFWRSGLGLGPQRYSRVPEQLVPIPEHVNKVQEPPGIVMGSDFGANRLASNFKTPPAQAISNLAVYRGP